MIKNKVVLEVETEGAQEAAAQLESLELAQERLAEAAREVADAEREAYAEDRVRTVEAIEAKKRSAAEQEAAISRVIAARKREAIEAERAEVIEHNRRAGIVSGLHNTLPAVKEVAKDLDNLGLSAGKAFTMASEGALSVVAAVGSGGVAGAIGLATVAVGAAVQAWVTYETSAKEAAKAAEEAKKADKERWDAFIKGAKDARAEQGKKTTADLEDIATAKQAQVVYLQARRQQIQTLALMERVGSDERNKLNKQAADALVDIKKAEEERKAAAEAARISKNRDLTREANSWLASEGQDAADAAAKREEEIAKNRAEWLTWTVKLNAEAWDRMGKDAVDAEARRVAEQERILSERDRARDEEEAKRIASEVAAQEALMATERATRARLDAEMALAAAIRKRREEDTKAIVVQAALSAETMAYGVAMSVVQPMVQDFTSALATLGTVNRENYRDLLIFSNELPAIIAREVQARLGALGAEATGKAIMASGDGLRESALGLSMLFINPAEAATHFTASGVHFASASAYGMLGTGALVGAAGIGAVRGAGGIVPLTKEEKERQGTSERLSGNEMWAGGGGSRGPAPAAGGPDFALTIINQPGSISAYDERRSAPTVSRVIRTARMDAFERRRMGA